MSKNKSDDTSWEVIMAELNDRSQMEDLRPHLASCRILPRGVNPETCVIKIEYLQKLARHWKLHHKRGFWRDHSTQSDLVHALFQHHLVLEASSARVKKTHTPAGAAADTTEPATPAEPAKEPSSKPPQAFFMPYSGDKFGTRGDYVSGNLYLSRLTTPGGSLRHGVAGLVSEPLAMDPDDGHESPESSDDDDAFVAHNLALDASETNKNCTLALCQFSSSEAFRSQIVEAGAITTLVHTWDSTDESMKDEVAVALCQLASDETKVSMLEDGALPAVLSLASSRVPTTQQLCANTLGLLSSVEDNIVVLLHEGILPALEVLSAAGDAVSKKLCAQVLCNLTQAKAHRSTMVKEDAVKIVVPLTTETMGDTRRYATVALANLCRHKRSQQKIVLEGVLSHLMRLSKSEDSVTHVSAVTAICKLCYNRATRTRLVKDGAVPIIVQQAASEDPKLQKSASSALLHLSSEDGPVRVTVMEGGAVATLLKLSEVGNDRTRQGCAVALCNLLCHPDTQGKIIELNALGAFDALASSTDEGIKSRTAATLYNLVVDPDTGSDVVRRGGLAPLLALTTAESAGTVELCALALHHLSANFDNHATMLEAGVVERVSELSKSNTDGVKLACANVLTNLTCNASLHEELKARGVLATMVALTAFDVVKSQTASALCNFTANHAMRSVLIEGGAVPVLIALARSTREATKQDCARAICNLSCLEGCEKAIVGCGGASGLVMIALFRSDTMETKGICASALLNLMTDADCRAQLVKEDLVWVLIKLASSEDTNDTTRSICARALCSLSYTDTGRDKLVENKATPALYFLCKFGGAVTRRCAAIALLNLCANKATHAALLSQDAVKCLVELADADDRETRLHSLGALVNLTASADGRARMVREAAADALSLDKCEDDETQRRCVIALCNLSSEYSVQGVFVSSGALGGLGKLCVEGSPLVQELCAQAMYNLSFQPASREAMANGGTLPALVAVSTVESPYVRRLCAAAFCNVSQETSCRDALLAAGAHKALVSLLQSAEDGSVTLACLIVLCNLTADKAHHSDVVGAEVVPAVLAQAEAGDTPADVLQLAARMLRNLSFHAPVRAALVSQGVCRFAVARLPGSDGDLRADCKAIIANAVLEESTLATAVDHGVVAALSNLASEETAAADQRSVASSLCCLSRPEDLRERVAELGIMGPLSVLLRSELEDVKKQCSTAVRNLSTCTTIRAQMVDAGTLPLLIDTMASKDDLSRTASSPSPTHGHHRHSILPTPTVAWDAGSPYAATDAVIVPAFTEAQVAASQEESKADGGADATTADAAATADATSDSKLDEEGKDDVPDRPQGASDLGNAEGLRAANKLSVVALGETLWQKVHVNDMEVASPTKPSFGADDGHESEEAPSRSPTPVTAQESKLDSDVVGEESDDELGFDFKYASPSAQFYAAQTKTPQSTVMFEASYAKKSPSKSPLKRSPTRR